jgi:hypothetical protein
MAPPWARGRIEDDFRIIAEDVATGVSPGRASSTATSWSVWTAFCHTYHIDPYLNIDDPIYAILLFAKQYRCGEISPSGTFVRARTVADAVRAVGQTLALMGKKDPRLTATGDTDFRLARLLSSWQKDDTPPWRVKPVPIHVVRTASNISLQSNTACAHAIADMIILAFFFLLRPGEYACSSSSESTPFRICDVHFIVNQRRLRWDTCSDAELDSTTFVALEFTTQKNGTKGELVGLSCSGCPILCPVKALVRRIKHFRRLRAPGTTPIYAYHNGSAWFHVTPALITASLRIAVTAMGPTLGFAPDDISARSLRSGGAMALLCAEVDTDKIRLLGRWRSDEMLRYLHIQAYPLTATFAHQMLLHGNFALIPNNPLHHP